MANRTLITGFPRIGENRELKKALENFWTNQCSFNELENTGRELRKKNWLAQKKRGIDLISSNDFSYYDTMLDMIVLLNAVPVRFRQIEDRTAQYFAMARGNDTAVAMEMTKWFNSNYHYIVPELDKGIEFKLNAAKIIKEYQEAKELGIKTKINIIGPITFLGLSKTIDGHDPYQYFDAILPVYKQLLEKIAELDDAVVIQMEEPILVKDPSAKQLSLIGKAYQELTEVSGKIRIIVTTYYEHASEAVQKLAETDIWGIGLDFVYGIKNLECLDFIKNKHLIAGIVDGRNIWINDLNKSLQLLQRISQVIPREKIIISTSCSLLHLPYSLAGEPENAINQWLSFCLEKTDEVAFLGRIFHSGELTAEAQQQLDVNKNIIESRINSGLIYNPTVADRIKKLSAITREGKFVDRIKLQKQILNLPLLPTTTIGSFPQTPELRKVRMDFKKGKISLLEYEKEIKKYIDDCVAFQEMAGLDVLVHGEPERNDMVEYFGELLNGFHFTRNGWVQSYGSRCVKPPVIFGDVNRPEPMTVKWISYAQSRTKKIMKGMLTGPVTIINWSFVRNDISRSAVANQIAVALSDEIRDLQKAGIKIIQVDEAAFKEGYPLRKENIADYEKWAVDSFKLTVSTAEKGTQIHTHMCYSDFTNIMKTIEEMDADVITIETAKSGNKLLNVFQQTGYKNEIGPGVYDIHSPRVPSVDEFKEQILLRLQVIEKTKFWINPDCGLKTRKWEEVKAALKNMVQAAEEIRKQ